ncbi:MAG: heme-copper oxidase subunit III [Gemmatimonadota bacterium]
MTSSHAAVMPAPGTPAAMEGMRVYNLKLGMWVFLLSEVMFFSGLIGAYIVLRFASPEQWAAPNEVLNVPLTGINTFILICSSVTMVKAFAAIEEGDQSGLRKWLIATVVLGATFVGIQVIEYMKLIEEGFVPNVARYAAEGGPLYGSTFFTMTGFHGAHVTVGVLAMIFTTVMAFRGRYTQANHGPIEILGLYWHFVDLVWIILFTIVYLV